jgi:hypothetical protein
MLILNWQTYCNEGETFCQPHQHADRIGMAAMNQTVSNKLTVSYNLIKFILNTSPIFNKLSLKMLLAIASGRWK